MRKLRVLTVLTVLAACLLVISLAHAGRLPNPKKIPFEEAVAMLNTPQLVQSWLYRYFRYDLQKLKQLVKKYKGKTTDIPISEPHLWGEDQAYPSEVYKRKKGMCIDAANFAAYCLYKAGFEVVVLSVKFERPSKSGATTHTVCAFKENGKWYIAGDTYRIRKGTDIDGPYSNLKEAAKGLASTCRTEVRCLFLGRQKFEGDTEYPGVQIIEGN